MRRISLFWLLALLIVNIDLSVGEPKRSFGLSGRSRAKSNSNLSVRRRTHVEPPKAPPQPSAPKQGHVSHTASAPQPPIGPPPAYSAGPSLGKTNMNAAPPAYSVGSGLNSHANYPRQGYAGVNSGTNMHQSPPGYGSFGNSPYNNHYGANNHYGGSGGFAQQPHPGFYGGGAGYPSGGYGGGMMGNGMMGAGMMGGGMMGGGMMGGGVQPLYIQQQRSSSPLGGIAAGAISGLAAYQLARAFSGSNHHRSEQHIYHHYDDPKENAPNQPNQPTLQSPQQTQQQQQQTIQTADANHQMPQYAQSVPAVPLAPFPNEAALEASKCIENCSSEASVANVTPVPEVDYEFPFSTIHPSLFPYASPLQNSDLEYWAKSVNKKLNSSTPDTTNSNLQSTTSTP